MNFSVNRFLYYAIACCLLFSSCDKEEAIIPANPQFISTSEINAYGGDLIELTVTDFNETKHKLLFNGTEITDYSYNEGVDKTATLAFTLPFKIGSGKLSISDGTSTVQGPQINYQKQYVLAYLSGYLIGYGMNGIKDDKLIAWDPSSKYLTELRLISISVDTDYGMKSVFGYKQHSITLTGPAVWRYDRLTGIGMGPSGKIHFFQNITGVGNVTQAHLFTSDLTTTTEYSGGIATGKVAWVSDLKLDSKENIYTMEYQLPYIQKATPTGVTVFAGSAQAGHADATGANARFTSITGLTLDKNDNVYVSDGNAVRMITPSGVVTTITGAVDAGDKTGPASEARYKRIAGITIDKNDQLYLLDNDNDKLKVLSADRKTVTTLKVAGNPSLKGHAEDFNIHMVVDSKLNIYYMMKSAPTKSVSLMVLVNEDNISENVLKKAISSPNNIVSDFVQEN